MLNNAGKRFTKVFSAAIILTTLLVLIYAGYIKNSNVTLTSSQNLANKSSGVDNLPPNPVVVCMIHTTPETWATKGRAVRHTWAPRCPIAILFYSNPAADANHPIRQAADAVGLDVAHGRDHLTAKTRAGLRYSMDKYGRVAEWYLKADDDTYVVMENLMLLLNEYSEKHRQRTPLYMGKKFFTHIPNGYTSGGAGYALNNVAARLMLEEGPSKFPDNCVKDGGYEDLETGRCLASFGVYPANTFDPNGFLRFHAGNPIVMFENPGGTWYEYIEFAGLTIGNSQLKATDKMLSPVTCTFHYVTPGQMFMYDYLLYHLKKPQWAARTTRVAGSLTFSTTTVTTTNPQKKA